MVPEKKEKKKRNMEKNKTLVHTNFFSSLKTENDDRNHQRKTKSQRRGDG